MLESEITIKREQLYELRHSIGDLRITVDALVDLHRDATDRCKNLRDQVNTILEQESCGESRSNRN